MAPLETLTIGAYEPEIEDEVEATLQSLAPYRIHPSLLRLQKPQAQGGYGTVWRGTLYGVAANQIPGEANGRIEEGSWGGETWFIVEGIQETRHIVLSKTTVAVKKLKLSENVRASDVKRRFVREMQVWSTLYHPNIVRFLGFHLDLEKDAAWLVSPWNDEGNLEDILAVNSLTRIEVMNIVEGVAQGLVYLHSRSQPIIHGDIKPANVLMAKDGKFQLCDFGLAKILNVDDARPTTSRSRGSIRRASAELLNGFKHTTASDIWAFGVLSYQVASRGRLPFHEKDLDDPAYMKRIVEDRLPQELPPLDRSHPALAPLLRRCWITEPSLRPDIQTCYQYLHSNNGDAFKAQTKALQNALHVIFDVANALAGLSLWVGGGVFLRYNNPPHPISAVAEQSAVYLAYTIMMSVAARTPWGRRQSRGSAQHRVKQTLNGEWLLEWWIGMAVAAVLWVIMYAVVAMVPIWVVEATHPMWRQA